MFNVKNDVGVGAIQLMVSSTLNSKKESFIDSKDFQIKSPVPYIAKINRSKSQILKNGGLLEWVLPKSFTQGTDVVSLSISSIPDLSIGHRVESLIRYPYGCIEQTTSSVFPQLYLADVMEGLNKSKIDNNINAGIKRLTKFVTSSGGFSYWPGQNSPSLWGSNYAGHFLILAKRNGYFVPQSMYDGLLNYHANNLRTGGLLTRVYRLYLLSLANKPQIGALNQIYHSEFVQLSNQSKWLLAAAYKLAGNTKVASEIAEKSDLKVVQFSENNYSYGSVLRDKAIILNSLIDLSDAEIPDYEIKRKRVLEDIAKELGSNEWLSTQTLGYSLLAVGRYATERTLEQPVNVNIKFPELDKEKNVKISRTVNDISILKGYGQPIVVSLDSNEPLYAQLNWEGVPDVMKIKELSNGLKINRKFLDDLGNEIKISSLDRGDSFWVHYQIKKKKDTSLEELALNQIIPSGWEIDNSRLSQSALPDWTNKLKIGKEEYLDIRDDSISWFFDMNRSTKSLDFILKVNVVTPGEFILAPTVAEAMYDNTFKAILPTQKVVVK